MKKISIISPCFNEENLVQRFFSEVISTIDKITNFQFEIIVVNDGSDDNSLKLLSKCASEDERITIIDLNRNFGKEIAISAGINNAHCDAAIIIDFDLQHPVEKIEEFINLWQNGYESVVGLRKDRKNESLLKSKTAQCFYYIYNIFAEIKIPNNSGDFRLIDHKVIEHLKLLSEKQRFMKGLFSWVGAKTAYIEYETKKRESGVSKFSGWKLWNFAIEGITSFSTAPLRIWTYIGFTISLASIIYGTFIFIETLAFGAKTPGYSSIIVTILFLGGIQIMGIGVIGEYLGRVYIESKQRPLYLIRSIINKKESR
jgi:glycosyltransferase involved in cell wall biosynthesis